MAPASALMVTKEPVSPALRAVPTSFMVAAGTTVFSAYVDAEVTSVGTTSFTEFKFKPH